MAQGIDPAAAPLSRALVLSTALDIVDRDGVAGLSMRRLGSALDRDPMSLYRYAASKAALLDGVAELVLKKLFIDPTDDEWESQLRTMARTYRDLALAHPQVVPLLVTPPPVHPPGPATRGHPAAPGTRPATADPRRIQHRRSVRCTSTDPSSDSCRATSSTSSRNWWTTPRRPTTCSASACTACPLKEFPLLRSLAPHLANYDGEAELERALDILLTGVRVTYPHHTRLRPRRSPKGSLHDPHP